MYRNRPVGRALVRGFQDPALDLDAAGHPGRDVLHFRPRDACLPGPVVARQRPLRARLEVEEREFRRGVGGLDGQQQGAVVAVEERGHAFTGHHRLAAAGAGDGNPADLRLTAVGDRHTHGVAGDERSPRRARRGGVRLDHAPDRDVEVGRAGPGALAVDADDEELELPGQVVPGRRDESELPVVAPEEAHERLVVGHGLRVLAGHVDHAQAAAHELVVLHAADQVTEACPVGRESEGHDHAVVAGDRLRLSSPARHRVDGLAHVLQVAHAVHAVPAPGDAHVVVRPGGLGRRGECGERDGAAVRGQIERADALGQVGELFRFPAVEGDAVHLLHVRARGQEEDRPAVRREPGSRVVAGLAGQAPGPSAPGGDLPQGGGLAFFLSAAVRLGQDVDRGGPVGGEGAAHHVAGLVDVVLAQGSAGGCHGVILWFGLFVAGE